MVPVTTWRPGFRPPEPSPPSPRLGLTPRLVSGGQRKESVSARTTPPTASDSPLFRILAEGLRDDIPHLAASHGRRDAGPPSRDSSAVSVSKRLGHRQHLRLSCETRSA
jgi:hypothetical protein